MKILQPCKIIYLTCFSLNSIIDFNKSHKLFVVLFKILLYLQKFSMNTKIFNLLGKKLHVG